MKKNETKHSLTFKDTGYELYDILDPKGQVIAKWNNESNRDYPEDLTIQRDIGALISKVFEAGYKLGNDNYLSKRVK